MLSNILLTFSVICVIALFVELRMIAKEKFRSEKKAYIYCAITIVIGGASVVGSIYV